MKWIKKSLILSAITLPVISGQINTINNKILINYINNTKVLNIRDIQDTKKSLTSMFLNNQLEKDVHVGQAANLTSITATQIKTAINKEILLELSDKTNQEITQQLDYTIEISTLNNQPLPTTNDLNKPISLQIKIISAPYSKILKDEVILTCNVDYPIFNFDDFLQNGLKMLYFRNHPGEIVDFLDIKFFQKPTETNLMVNNIGQPVLNKNINTFNYFGESIFENNSDIDQTYETPTWSKSISDASSVSISAGVNMGFNCNIDAFGLSVNVNFQEQESTTKAEAQTITAPSIPTIVQPHHKTQVLVYLNAFVSSQNITIDSDISGNVSATLEFFGWSTKFSASIKNIIKYYQDTDECPNSITFNSDNESIHIKNQASVLKYDVGTLWKVITNPLN